MGTTKGTLVRIGKYARLAYPESNSHHRPYFVAQHTSISYDPLRSSHLFTHSSDSFSPSFDPIIYRTVGNLLYERSLSSAGEEICGLNRLLLV